MSEIRIRIGNDWTYPVDLIRIPPGQSLQQLTLTVSVGQINGAQVFQKIINNDVKPGQGRITNDGSDGTPAAAMFEGPAAESARLVPGHDYFWDMEAFSSAGKTTTIRSGTIVAIEDVA